MSRRDPLLGFNFSVSLLDSPSSGNGGAAVGTAVLSTAGIRVTAGFSEVSGLEMSMDVEEYKPGGFNGAVLKFPGRIKWSNLVLKRGMASRPDPLDPNNLWGWYQLYLDGVGKRKDGVIILNDQAGSPKQIWGFRRGLPLKWTGPSLNASQSAVAVEAIEIAHEGLIDIRGAGLIGRAIRETGEAIASLF